MQLPKLWTLGAALAFVSATAALAATQVNIADPNKTTRAADVEIGNRLAVQEVAPSTFYHSYQPAIGASSNCVRIAAPPRGKALVVRQVRINTYADPSPGADNTLYLFADSTCDFADAVASATPAGLGVTPIAFDPGVSIPMGYGFSIQVFGSSGLGVEAYVDGFVVAAGVAPVAGQVIESAGRRPR